MGITDSINQSLPIDRAVVVFDVNKRSSFESALSMILDHKKASPIDHVGSKMPIILVGTKTDLSASSGSRTKSEQYVSQSEQRNRAERYNVTLNVSNDINPKYNECV